MGYVINPAVLHMTLTVGTVMAVAGIMAMAVVMADRDALR